MASPPFGFLWGALSNFLSSYSKSSRTTNNYTPSRYPFSASRSPLYTQDSSPSLNSSQFI
jgi:hypothetical protein